MDENKYRKPATARTDSEPAQQSNEPDWQEIYDQQLAENEAPTGGFLNNQWAKLGCGCALPALFLLGTCSSMVTQRAYGGGPSAMLIGEMTGTVIAGIILVWVPIYLFWLRDQSKWLIGASFALIAGLFTVLGLSKIGNGHKAMMDDVSAISNVQFDKEGNPILQPGMSAKGPMSKLMVDVATEQFAIRTDFDAELAKLGISDMMFADRVKRNPQLVQNCRRILATKEVIEGYRTRHLTLIRGVPDRIDALDISYVTKANMKRGAVDKLETNVKTVNKQWDIQARTMDPLHRTCLLLSKRNWQAQGTLFAFNSQADLGAFDRAMNEINQLNAELQAETQVRVNDVQAQQEKLKSQITR
jgi:hypothetical protein